MGISASSTLSRERTADDGTTESTADSQLAAAAPASAAVTTEARHSGTVALNRVVRCVRRKSHHSADSSDSSSSEEAATSSAAEMSDDDSNSSSGGSDQRQGRRRLSRHHDDLESESVDNASASSATSSAEVQDGDAATGASEFTAPQRSTATTKSTVVDKSLAEFREELRIKREQRRTAIADLKNEVLQLRSDLVAERLISQQLRTGMPAANGLAADPLINQPDGNDVVAASNDVVVVGNNSADDDNDANELASPARNVENVLRMQLANVNHQLQLANGDVLSLSAELSITQKQVGTLKEVIAVSKEMVKIREAQLEQVSAFCNSPIRNVLTSHLRLRSAQNQTKRD